MNFEEELKQYLENTPIEELRKQWAVVVEQNKREVNQLPDLSQQVGFWKRLQAFVADVETSDMAGVEEKEVILYVCCRKIEEFNTKEK